MTPVITHLRANFLELPLPAEQQLLNWTFDASLKKLGPDFYRKIIPLHPVLNMEYSVLCNQLRHNFSNPQQISQDQIIEQLITALMLAELLEHIHLYYLIVPREVERLRRQQELYRGLLAEMAGYSFTTKATNIEAVQVGLSLSQQIRNNTALTNWFRLLFTRSKRFLNFLDLVGTGSDGFRNFVSIMDKYCNPVLAYVAWCFFIPRFSVNLFLMVQHIIPGFWMDEEEKSLGFYVRLVAQIQRRWFELVNDSVWITIGILNCFILTGAALAPVSVYLTLVAFVIDVAAASFRAYIELNRLYTIQEEYTDLFQQEENPGNQKAIEDYQNFITQRIKFEQLRLGLSVCATTSIFIVMCLAIPPFAVNPIIPLIGAILLLVIWVASFTLTRTIEQYRPNDTVEMPSKLTKIGFFAKKQESLPEPRALTPEEEICGLEGYSCS